MGGLGACSEAGALRPRAASPPSGSREHLWPRCWGLEAGDGAGSRGCQGPGGQSAGRGGAAAGRQQRLSGPAP